MLAHLLTCLHAYNIQAVYLRTCLLACLLTCLLTCLLALHVKKCGTEARTPIRTEHSLAYLRACLLRTYKLSTCVPSEPMRLNLLTCLLAYLLTCLLAYLLLAYLLAYWLGFLLTTNLLTCVPSEPMRLNSSEAEADDPAGLPGRGRGRGRGRGTGTGRGRVRVRAARWDLGQAVPSG